MSKLKTYTALIVDDELSSRTSLSIFLHKYCKQIDVLSTAENIIEAKNKIDELKPDIVFLDIEMPHGNAFDLLDKYSELSFQVIFITAFSQYAVKAFNLSNASYLLKPVDIEELIEEVNNACRQIEQSTKWEHTTELLETMKSKTLGKIVIPLIDGFQVVAAKEVLYLEASDNFSVIHLSSGKKLLACRKLKFYEDNLTSSGFCRIHRSSIINIDHVVKYNKGKGGFVTLSSGKQLDVSQSRKKEFLNQFSY